MGTPGFSAGLGLRSPAGSYTTTRTSSRGGCHTTPHLIIEMAAIHSANLSRSCVGAYGEFVGMHPKIAPAIVDPCVTDCRSMCSWRATDIARRFCFWDCLDWNCP
jgi:hypothetical protein